MAQEVADGCTGQHGQAVRDPMPFDPIGQNIASKSVAMTNMTNIVWRWYSEEKYYFYDNKACVDGQVCGHYTQVLYQWRIQDLVEGGGGGVVNKAEARSGEARSGERGMGQGGGGAPGGGGGGDTDCYGQMQSQIQKHPYDNHFIINVHFCTVTFTDSHKIFEIK